MKIASSLFAYLVLGHFHIGHRASGIGHRASGIPSATLRTGLQRAANGKYLTAELRRQLKDGKTNFTFAFSHFTSFNHTIA